MYPKFPPGKSRDERWAALRLVVARFLETRGTGGLSAIYIVASRPFIRRVPVQLQPDELTIGCCSTQIVAPEWRKAQA